MQEEAKKEESVKKNLDWKWSTKDTIIIGDTNTTPSEKIAGFDFV